MLRILVCNDDGVLAAGLMALAEALRPLGEVVVVAPEAERSGFSSALTLDRPLRPVLLPNGYWAVNGTPADCAYIARHGWFDQPFDLLVSGINSGANLGDDVLYSGTVGAAFEGRGMRLPALAVSLVGPNVRQYQHASDYAVAARWVHDFVKKGIPPLPARHIYNINIPDLPVLKTVQATRLGQRATPLPILNDTDPRGRHMCWIGLSGDELTSSASDASAVMTDFAAIAAGHVSITPIQMDATSHTALQALQSHFAQTP
jgi:5'-nucleotidase